MSLDGLDEYLARVAGGEILPTAPKDVVAFVAEWDAEHPEDAEALRRHLEEAPRAEVLSREIDARTSGPPKGGGWIRFLCGDCRGQTIAHVTIVNARPVLWVRERDGRGARIFADLPSASGGVTSRAIATCRGDHDYPIPFSAVEPILTAGLGRRAVVTLHHDSAPTVRYHRSQNA